MSSPALRLEPDRVGVIVTGVGVVIACAAGLPVAMYVTQKVQSVPGLIGCGVFGAAVAAFMMYRRAKALGIDWVELTDEEFGVSVTGTPHRIPWSEITRVVQNFEPEEEWYVYTTASPRPVLVFDPSSLSTADKNKMVEFTKGKTSFERSADPQYAAKAFKA